MKHKPVKKNKAPKALTQTALELVRLDGSLPNGWAYAEWTPGERDGNGWTLSASVAVWLWMEQRKANSASAVPKRMRQLTALLKAEAHQLDESERRVLQWLMPPCSRLDRYDRWRAPWARLKAEVFAASPLQTTGASMEKLLVPPVGWEEHAPWPWSRAISRGWDDMGLLAWSPEKAWEFWANRPAEALIAHLSFHSAHNSPWPWEVWWQNSPHPQRAWFMRPDSAKVVTQALRVARHFEWAKQERAWHQAAGIVSAEAGISPPSPARSGPWGEEDAATWKSWILALAWSDQPNTSERRFRL